jgi:Uma2 family endonuclease
MNALTWEDIIADRPLRDLPCKIETNRYHRIIMSPASFWHSDYQTETATLLLKLLPGGKAPVGCAIQTTEGVRVADVVWISLERRALHRRAVVLPIAPEICVVHRSQRAAASPRFRALCPVFPQCIALD